MENIIKIIVDNGVTVGIICYFAFINYQFMSRIDTTLATIKTLLKHLDDSENDNSKDDGK